MLQPIRLGLPAWHTIIKCCSVGEPLPPAVSHLMQKFQESALCFGMLLSLLTRNGQAHTWPVAAEVVHKTDLLDKVEQTCALQL
jgi:hypothetical protein